MQAYRNKRETDFYAPYGTCRKCGWTGKDWGFYYHGYCKKCHDQWRKEKAEERRRLKPPNENIEVADGIIVTRNIRERLEKQAYCDVPPTRKSQLAGRWGDISSLVAKIAMVVFVFILIILSDFEYSSYARYLFFIMMMSGLLGISGFLVDNVCNSIKENERTTQMPEINARLEELARERQKKIDDTNTFYASSEWRLVREQMIQEQERVCQECGRRIKTDYDLTVDHIKPRSKFPELALDKSNLQVLCRRCNSAKGVTYNEASITNQDTASIRNSTS